MATAIHDCKELRELVRVLGLDPGSVREFHLHLVAGDIVTADAVLCVPMQLDVTSIDDEVRRTARMKEIIQEVKRKYVLVEKEKEDKSTKDPK